MSLSNELVSAYKYVMNTDCEARRFNCVNTLLAALEAEFPELTRPEPKFKVGQVVVNICGEALRKIDSLSWEDTLGSYVYYFGGYTSFSEHHLRPLTQEEIHGKS
jgi:hypothetical protein